MQKSLKFMKELLSFYSNYNSVYEGYDIWKEHIESFGFGNYLNNDFKSGQKGCIPESSYFDKYYQKGRWNSSTILSMSIGQGELECTPIQMANLSATIANRGFYYIPHIIKEIENDTIPTKFSEKHHTSIDPQHFKIVIDGMEQVLENIDGTAFMSKVKGISICGKTGTAENSHGDDHSIFIAFAPKENPKIGSCGVLIANTKGKIVDIDTGKALGPNQRGELCVKGPQVIQNITDKSIITLFPQIPKVNMIMRIFFCFF